MNNNNNNKVDIFNTLRKYLNSLFNDKEMYFNIKINLHKDSVINTNNDNYIDMLHMKKIEYHLNTLNIPIKNKGLYCIVLNKDAIIKLLVYLKLKGKLYYKGDTNEL